jgi:hypothetical protein
MKKPSLRKSDFLVALGATALSASILACGQPRANVPVGQVPAANLPGAGSGQPIAAPPANPQQLNDLSKYPAAHINVLTGTYQGHIVVMDEDYNYQDVPYTVVLVPNTMPGSTGRQFQVSFQSGNKTLSSYTQTSQSTYAGKTLYTITSYAQNVPAIYPNAPVMLQIQLAVNANNLLDPTSSAIRIAEGVFFQNVVDFEYDLEKR